MVKSNDKLEFSENLEQIGTGIRNLRKDKGYTSYYAIAYDLNLSPSQYWSYEKGKNMNLITLFSILKFHDIGLKEFVEKYY